MKKMNRIRVACVVGTRPEMIKMAPVIRLFKASSFFEPIVIFSGQHRGLLDQLAGFFGIEPDVDLDLMRPDQGLGDLSARALVGLQRVLQRVSPHWVLAQGDTTTVFMAALAAYYEKIPFAHLEAGLRTDDVQSPFPEEGNRRMISAITRLHLVPTPLAAENLLAEGILRSAMAVTGNTVVDAALQVARRSSDPERISGRRQILITVHRRENHGEPLESILHAVDRLTSLFEDVDFLWPVHPNPAVSEKVRARFMDNPQVQTVDPLNYGELIQAIQASTLLLTDSGGLQEEGPALGVPVLVLRRETERPEGLEAGVSRLVGVRASSIVRETSRLLLHEDLRQRMCEAPCPYGDGHAAQRVVEAFVAATPNRIGNPEESGFVHDARVESRSASPIDIAQDWH
jgi:UDP-N-acetylglucosamine 2-epimerase (non-hydrolysing)